MPDKSKIDDEKTFQRFKYRSTDLGPKSTFRVITVCGVCGEPREAPRCSAERLCRSCSRLGKPSPMEGKRHTEETRQKMRDNHADVSGENNPMFGKTVSDETRCKQSIAKMGENNPSYGKAPTAESRERMSIAQKKRPPVSEETRGRMSDARVGKSLPPETRGKMSASRTGVKRKPMTQSTKDKLSIVRTGVPPSFETRRKHSATLQGIPYDEWESFAKDQPYCPKFNEACRESNREKYDRRCFLSDVTEADNGQKLSVHHYDMNKAQGCDGHAWKLVPLCRELHNTSHTPTWVARIQYLLNHVWSGV